jgi:hypothetical protein
MASGEPHKRLTDMQKRVVEVPNFIDAKPGQKRVMATYPLTGRFRGI